MESDETPDLPCSTDSQTVETVETVEAAKEEGWIEGVAGLEAVGTEDESEGFE